MTDAMKVVEIFSSIDGEGVRVGRTVSFIRLAGCNLRCSYCDTLYALFGEEEPCRYKEMSVGEVFDAADKSFGRITLTGGEPLLHKDSPELCDMLAEAGCEVNIETNGAADITEFAGRVKNKDKIFFTIDYKLPSSGMEDKMLLRNFKSLRPCDVVKLVIGSGEDAKKAKDVVRRINAFYPEGKRPHIYAGTVFGAYEPSDVVDMIISDPELKDVVFQLQIHKFIWDPEKRGV